MGKKRVYEFAKEMHVDNKDVIDIAKNLGIEVKNHMSSIDQDQEAKIKGMLSKQSAGKAPSSQAAKTPAKAAKTSSAAHKEAAKKPVAASAKSNDHADVAEHSQKNAKPAAKQENKPARSNKTSDGKIILSKSTILRPRSTQTAHTNTNHNRGGNTASANNTANGRNSNRSNNNNNNRSANNANRSGNNNRSNERNRNDRNRRFDNQRVTGPMPRAGRPTAANGNPRPVAGNGGKFVKPASERQQPKRQEAVKPANAASKRSEQPRTERPRTEQPAATTNQRFTKPAPVPAAAAPKPASAGSQDNRNSRRGGGNSNFGRSNSYGNRNGFNRNNRRNKKNKRRQQSAPKKEMPQRKERPLPETLIYEVGMNAQDLGKILHREPAELIKKLFMLGVMVNQNQSLDKDTIELLATDYGIDAQEKVHEDISDLDKVFEEENKNQDNLQPRPPVVTIMGHVDHGKTTLLDKLRHTHVTEGEAGGITQHIGAYQVKLRDRLITFLDTPGHAAFTNMRARGADITDIVVLVVAADDGVMPQTVEAINHAKAAGVEIIVAINKVDKPSANIERVKQELSEYELIPEDWGGSTIFVPVSAKTHQGIEELLEMILLTSEVCELKANPKRKARGLVIEAQLDKGKGPVATILVQKGTLHVGDFIAAGASSGKVRAMMDDKGRRVKEAGPSTPVEILGLSDVPNAGEVLVATENDKEAKNFAATFISENKNRLLEETKAKMSLDDLFSQIQEGNLKELNLIVKADVQGSVEAVKQSLVKLSNDEVVVKVIHGGVGAINESDVTLASASNAIIIGFNVRPDATAKATAEQEGVDLRLYRVIYQAIEDVEAAMKGMLDPVFEEKVIGHAEVRQIFKASGVGNIAGSYVLDGVFQRGCTVRISREGKQIFEGPLASLKRFKDDVKEVKAGYECGLVFEGFNDIQELDQVEAYIMVEVPR